jgi:hypothetical protein
MKTEVSIVFPSGRRSVRDVAAMLGNNLSYHGHLDDINVHLIIAYDPTFQGLMREDFQLDDATEKRFTSVTYSGPDDFAAIQDSLERKGLKIGPEAEILFNPTRGYSSHKNRAVFRALEKGSDHILFLDDDEYFIAPFRRQDGKLGWVEQDVLGGHKRFNPGADITNGNHVGYVSPIPSDIGSSLEVDIRQMLGKALAVGNEVIDERSFLYTRDSVKYGEDAFMNSGASEIPELRGVRTLYGGNLMLNSRSIRDGKLPPFFNPPGARGEDAIMGMQVSRLSVQMIPVYTFHDPFQKYLGITEGTFPDEIEAIQVTPGTIDRFAKACMGWVKYAPFLIKMTSSSERDYASRIGQMRQLHEIGGEIDCQLGTDKFRHLGAILEEYDARADKDVRELHMAKDAWRGIVSSMN